MKLLRLLVTIAALSVPVDGVAQAAADTQVAQAAPFSELFGKTRSGMALPNFAVETAYGNRARLYDFVQGQAVVLAFWDAARGPGTSMLRYLDEVAKKYRAQRVTVAGIACFESRQKFDGWLKANRDRYSFQVLFDPAGKGPPLPRTREEAQATPLAEQIASADRWRAYVNTTIAGRLLNASGGTAPMPFFLVLDSEATLLGALSPDGDRKEAMGNLLLRAGIRLAEEDKPKRVYTREETRVPELERMPAVKAVPVGSVAPDFTAMDAAGKEVNLSGYRGKVVVLDFWATWCGPCLNALAHMQKLAAQYKKDGVVVLAVCTQDKRSHFENWLKKNRQNYPDIVFLHDPAANTPERVSLERYGVTAIPHQFVIDREGKIVDSIRGYMQGEVVVDAALAKAGVEVDAAILTKARQDLLQRNKR